MDIPTMRKTRRRPIFEMTQLFAMIAITPTAVRIHEFWKALPTFAISKKYVPYAREFQ
jgi:hypothetical protein